MNNEEYIIISKTALEKRIEELEKYLEDEPNPFLNTSYQSKLDSLNNILSQSIPLIPEIEKAFDAGRFRKEYKEELTESEIFDLECEGISYNPNQDYNYIRKYEFKDKQDYISNLKLDI